MGSTCSRSTNRMQLVNDKLNEIVEFDPSQSRLVGFTVPNSSSPNLPNLRSISDDAASVIDALVQKKVLQLDKLRPLSGALCKFRDIKEQFTEEATQVGEKGAFIALFNGHGTTKHGPLGFVPSDYDGTNDLLITAKLLSDWLINNKRIRPKFVLLIINCCYAGELATTLFENYDPPPYPVYVMASSEPHEKSFAFENLEHSIFYYFLTHAIKMATIEYFPTEVKLPLKSIFDECKELCIALCSLLKDIKMSPMFMRTKKCYQPQGGIRSDKAELFDPKNYYKEPREENRLKIDERCYKWIESCTNVNGGLFVLNK